MKKKLIAFFSIVAILIIGACGGEGTKSETPISTTSEPPKSMVENKDNYDPKRGEGKFDETNVTIGTIDAAMASKGKAIAETKCFSCHKLTDEKLVGPGWKGVTGKHNPHWLMNFITNPDPMINKDPELQAQLEICLVRMPNQNLTDEEARAVLEYMRQNDGAK